MLQNILKEYFEENLEVSCSYDSSICYEFFEEYFTRLNESALTGVNAEGDVFLYHSGYYESLTDYLEDRKNIVKVTEDLRKARGKLIQFLREEFYLDEEDAVYYYGKGFWDIVEFALTEHWFEADGRDSYFAVEELFNQAEIDYVCRYEVIQTRGYGQGDFAEVIFFEDFFKQAWGKRKINYKNLQKEIDHLFWDAPVYIEVLFGDLELREWDILEDEYEYDKDAVVEKVENLIMQICFKEEKKACRDAVREVLHEILYNEFPEYPEYH